MEIQIKGNLPGGDRKHGGKEEAGAIEWEKQESDIEVVIWDKEGMGSPLLPRKPIPAPGAPERPARTRHKVDISCCKKRLLDITQTPQ
jgi:hypothetical protein